MKSKITMIVAIAAVVLMIGVPLTPLMASYEGSDGAKASVEESDLDVSDISETNDAAKFSGSNLGELLQTVSGLTEAAYGLGAGISNSKVAASEDITISKKTVVADGETYDLGNKNITFTDGGYLLFESGSTLTMTGAFKLTANGEKESTIIMMDSGSLIGYMSYGYTVPDDFSITIELKGTVEMTISQPMSPIIPTSFDLTIGFDITTGGFVSFNNTEFDGKDGTEASMGISMATDSDGKRTLTVNAGIDGLNVVKETSTENQTVESAYTLTGVKANVTVGIETTKIAGNFSLALGSYTSKVNTYPTDKSYSAIAESKIKNVKVSGDLSVSMGSITSIMSSATVKMDASASFDSISYSNTTDINAENAKLSSVKKVDIIGFKSDFLVDATLKDGTVTVILTSADKDALHLDSITSKTVSSKTVSDVKTTNTYNVKITNVSLTMELKAVISGSFSSISADDLSGKANLFVGKIEMTGTEESGNKTTTPMSVSVSKFVIDMKDLAYKDSAITANAEIAADSVTMSYNDSTKLSLSASGVEISGKAMVSRDISVTEIIKNMLSNGMNVKANSIDSNMSVGNKSVSLNSKNLSADVKSDSGLVDLNFNAKADTLNAKISFSTGSMEYVDIASSHFTGVSDKNGLTIGDSSTDTNTTIKTKYAGYTESVVTMTGKCQTEIDIGNYVMSVNSGSVTASNLYTPMDIVVKSGASLSMSNCTIGPLTIEDKATVSGTTEFKVSDGTVISSADGKYNLSVSDESDGFVIVADFTSGITKLVPSNGYVSVNAWESGLKYTVDAKGVATLEGNVGEINADCAEATYTYQYMTNTPLDLKYLDAVELTAPTVVKEGQTFIGWSDGTGNILPASTTIFIMPAHDVHIIEVWTAAADFENPSDIKTGTTYRIDAKLNASAGVDSTRVDAIIADMSDGDSVSVKTVNGTVSFDKTSMGAFSGNDLAVNVSFVNNADSEAVRNVVGNSVMINIDVTSGDTEVTNLDGKATISVEYTLKDGENAGEMKIVYIDSDGRTTALDTTYQKTDTEGVVILSAETTHFSDYAIMAVSEPSSSSDYTMIIVCIVLIAVFLIAAYVMVKD